MASVEVIRGRELSALYEQIGGLGVDREAVRAVLAAPLRALAGLRHLHGLATSVLARNPGADAELLTSLDAMAAGLPAPQWWGEQPPPMHGLGPCSPAGLVSPYAIFEMALSVAVAASDPDAHSRALDQLASLWASAGVLDVLAHRGSHGDDDLRNGLVRYGLDPGHLAGPLMPGFDPWDPFGGPPGGGPVGPDDGPLGPGFPGGPHGPHGPGIPGGGPHGPHGPGIPGGGPHGPHGPGLPGGGPHGPGVPLDPCEARLDMCRRLVLTGGAMMRPGPLPVSVSAHGITAIEPPSACWGEEIAIIGSGFGADQGDRVVVIGNQLATVLTWSPTKVTIVVPSGATSGCVGFRDETVEGALHIEIGRRQQGFAQLSEGLACLGLPPVPPPELPLVGSSAPCNGFNAFMGTLPELDSFTANGQSALVVEPGTVVTLAWQVRNATQVRIRQISASGPPCTMDDPLPAAALPATRNGSHSLGPFSGNTPVDAAYELTAENACGSITAVVGVKLRRQPDLRITGVELVQAIQRPDPTQPGAIGTQVRLARRRPTTLRVYVQSGLTGGFRYGAGPDELPITGVVDLAGDISIAMSGIKPRPGTAYVAKPVMPRDDPLVLEFDLPWDRCVGGVHLDITVKATTASWGTGPGWARSTTLSATFQPRRQLTLVRMRLRDDDAGGGPAPSIAQWRADMRGALDRYPIAEDGFVEAIAPGWEELGTAGTDLRTEEGWQDYIDDVDDIADNFTDYGQIYVVATPQLATYALNGKAHDYEDIPWPMSDDHRVMLAQTGLRATYAHEMAHTLGIGHAPCGDPEEPDPRLPGTTELGTLGRRASDGTIFKDGWSELMSYCTPPSGNYQDRWPSVACWNILFDTLA